MSYRCQKCNMAQDGSPTKIVTETRYKSYSPREYVHNRVKVQDPGGEGTEIVKELNLCPSCTENI